MPSGYNKKYARRCLAGRLHWAVTPCERGWSFAGPRRKAVSEIPGIERCKHVSSIPADASRPRDLVLDAPSRRFYEVPAPGNATMKCFHAKRAPTRPMNTDMSYGQGVGALRLNDHPRLTAGPKQQTSGIDGEWRRHGCASEGLQACAID